VYFALYFKYVLLYLYFVVGLFIKSLFMQNTVACFKIIIYSEMKQK